MPTNPYCLVQEYQPYNPWGGPLGPESLGCPSLGHHLTCHSTPWPGLSSIF